MLIHRTTRRSPSNLTLRARRWDQGWDIFIGRAKRWDLVSDSPDRNMTIDGQACGYVHVLFISLLVSFVSLSIRNNRKTRTPIVFIIPSSFVELFIPFRPL